MAPLQQSSSVNASSFTSTIHNDPGMTQEKTHIDPMDSQTLAVMCVSLSFAAISVIAALFAFYWFVRMRRGFRQDMIMLLIQSDMAKALWLVISPLFHFITKKPFSSNWAFCQVSGFFLTATIEASDIAVLLIAIHTALFIIKRKHPGAAVGLQPYRRIAYTLWAVVPIILAAVVPLTGGSFVDNGPHCYLPAQPNWYRNALSWVPRYIIFGFILVTYTWLYLYVFIRFRGFSEDQRRASNQTAQSPFPSTRRQSGRKWRSHSVPPTYSVITRGPDSTPDNASKNSTSRPRQGSFSSTVSTLRLGESVSVSWAPKRMVRGSSISWNLIDFGHGNTRSPANTTPRMDAVPVSPMMQPITLSSADRNEGVAAVAVRTPEPIHAPGLTDPPSHDIGGRRHSIPGQNPGLTPNNSSRMFRNSTANIVTPPRQSLSRPGHSNKVGLGEHLPSSIYLGTEVSEETMRRSRDRMQRQMWLLFVYPAIYMLTWVAPLVAHVCRYDDVYVMSYPSSTSAGTIVASVLGSPSTNERDSSTLATEPIVLRIISMASLCIGAAVDCCFFSAWEQPWKHLRGGFWEGLAMRFRIHRLCGADSGARTRGPGRSRDEQIADERAARTRRDRETAMILALRSERTAGGGSTGGREVKIGSGGENQARREWWDVLDDTNT
ncbi:G protein-coupled glucose receptor regulating Gpa2-domain-containing protein [Xylaria intraflava]|nr:G protein-coupled glucose receptor regulating Gpa2-domain-containing protein [Xylaria intraflava]